MIKLFSTKDNPLDILNNGGSISLLYFSSWVCSFIALAVLLGIHAYYLFPFVPLATLLFLLFNADWIQMAMKNWKLILKRKLQAFLEDSEEEKQAKKQESNE